MSTLTLDALNRARELVGNPSGDYPIKVQVMTSKVGPARVHSRSRNGGKRSYHKRIQRKWVKRFGIADKTLIPRGQVYLMKSPWDSGETMIIRDDDVTRLHGALPAGDKFGKLVMGAALDNLHRRIKDNPHK